MAPSGQVTALQSTRVRPSWFAPTWSEAVFFALVTASIAGLPAVGGLVSPGGSVV